MSHVRMCDRCGTIFSENMKGWSTFTVTRQSTNAHGQPISTSEGYDACGDCSFPPAKQPVLKMIEDTAPDDEPETNSREKLDLSSRYGKTAQG